MTRTTEVLAETPMFGTDAFSEVLDIVHVRGETARNITSDGPLEYSVPAETPCVYIVNSGHLKIRAERSEAIELGENQIALMLHGTAHIAEFDNKPSQTKPGSLVSRITADNTRPSVNCFWGSFTVDGELAAQILQSLPEVIVLDGLAENPIQWVEELCALVLGELGTTRPGSSLMVSRLLDLLLVIILRRWAQAEDSLPGWLAAAKDERISRAVSAIHTNPAKNLTNGELAKLAGMSVSNFADRFKQVMGQQPGAYLRAWRLDQAAEALLHSSLSVEAIADRVGYASKEAFSRAFQAKFSMSPTAWRLARQNLEVD